MIEVETWPRLHQPVLVVALAGWIDAGLAGANGMATLAEQLDSARRFARLELAELNDLRQTRPMVHLDGETREIGWPAIELVAGTLGRDVVLCFGPEPSLHWRSVLGDLVDLAVRLGVVAAYTLGGAPASVSHRRPVRLVTTATSVELHGAVGGSSISATYPAGAQSVLQVLLGQAGIPTTGLWAQVPQYVAATPSPAAALALLHRLGELSELAIDTSELAVRVDSYVHYVEENLIERPEVEAALTEIESRGDDAESDADAFGILPSGDELATEIERFLRGES